MAETVGSRYLSGRTLATGAALDILMVGFRPTKVTVYNQTNQYKEEWNLAMGSAAARVTDNNGTATDVLADGITPLNANTAGNPGFRIGALANINDTVGEVLIWEAFE